MVAVRRGSARRGGRSRLGLGADLLEGEEGRLHRARWARARSIFDLRWVSAEGSVRTLPDGSSPNGPQKNQPGSWVPPQAAAKRRRPQALTPTRGSARVRRDLAGGEPQAEVLEPEARPEAAVGRADHGIKRRGFQTSFRGETLAKRIARRDSWELASAVRAGVADQLSKSR